MTARAKKLVSVLFFIPINPLSTQGPETSVYRINQIIWSPDCMSPWLPNSFNATQSFSVSHKAPLAPTLPVSLNPPSLPPDPGPQPGWHSPLWGLIPFIPLGIFTGCSLCLEHCACWSMCRQLPLITQGSPQMSLLQRSPSGIQTISRSEATLLVALYSHGPVCFHRPCDSLKLICLVTCLLFILFIIIICLFIVSISGTSYLKLGLVSQALNGIWSPVQ